MLRQPVEAVKQPVVGLVVGVLGAGEAAPVHAVVNVAEHHVHDLVDFAAQRLRVEVGGARPVVGSPLGGQVEGELGVVIGDNLPGCDLDDGGHGDATVVAGEA